MKLPEVKESINDPNVSGAQTAGVWNSGESSRLVESAEMALKGTKLGQSILGVAGEAQDTQVHLNSNK
jgi:hypothetical protein